MGLIDFILNLAGLLLWLNWRSVGLARATRLAGVSLAATVRPADAAPVGRSGYLVALVGLLFVRSFFYWQMGAAVGWTPRLDLGAVSLPFRSDYPTRAVLFSVLGFAWMLANFYLWLILLVCVNRRLPDTEPTQRLVRIHLGPLARWPTAIVLLAPWTAAAALWLLCHPLLTQMGLVPPPSSWLHATLQAILVGFGVVLSWRYVICAFLLLHAINSQFYLGDFGFWPFVHATAANLLRPARRLPLRIGRLDLAPALGVILVLLAGEMGGRALTWLFARLPA